MDKSLKVLSSLSLIDLGFYNFISFIVCFEIFGISRILFFTYVPDSKYLITMTFTYFVISISILIFNRYINNKLVYKFLYYIGLILAVISTVALIQFLLSSLAPIIEPNPTTFLPQILLSFVITSMYLVSLTFRNKFVFLYKCDKKYLKKLKSEYLNNSLRGISLALVFSSLYRIFIGYISLINISYFVLSLILLIHFFHFRKTIEESIIKYYTKEDHTLDFNMKKI